MGFNQTSRRVEGRFQVVDQDANAIALEFAFEAIARHDKFPPRFLAQLPQLFFQQAFNRGNILGLLGNGELQYLVKFLVQKPSRQGGFAHTASGLNHDDFGIALDEFLEMGDRFFPAHKTGIDFRWHDLTGWNDICRGKGNPKGLTTAFQGLLIVACPISTLPTVSGSSPVSSPRYSSEYLVAPLWSDSCRRICAFSRPRASTVRAFARLRRCFAIGIIP
ncbi:MAG: hypothetical protein F6K30_21430 [Cyanothece sp. SIO2G6]|nr:hypothetical protein [Cyanothece sp. SIO2G6]